MISNEIRNRIEAKCDIHEIKKSIETEITRGKNTRKKGETPISSRSVRSHERLNNIRKCPIPWTCESRVVRSDLMSVCVTGKVLMHKKTNVSNNMII